MRLKSQENIDVYKQTSVNAGFMVSMHSGTTIDSIIFGRFLILLHRILSRFFGKFYEISLKFGKKTYKCFNYKYSSFIRDRYLYIK